jgi:hypothetical protein
MGIQKRRGERLVVVIVVPIHSFIYPQANKYSFHEYLHYGWTKLATATTMGMHKGWICMAFSCGGPTFAVWVLILTFLQRSFIIMGQNGRRKEQAQQDNSIAQPYHS